MNISAVNAVVPMCQGGEKVSALGGASVCAGLVAVVRHLALRWALSSFSRRVRLARLSKQSVVSNLLVTGGGGGVVGGCPSCGCCSLSRHCGQGVTAAEMLA